MAAPPSRLTRLLSGLLAPVPPVHRALRSAYHALWYANAEHTVACAGWTATFRTPTPTIAEQVATFTGEGEVLEAFLSGLRPGDVVWDVGAGFGLYTVLAARALAGSGSVVAFEPEPRILGLLEANLAANGLPNVQIAPSALGSEDGETGLYAARSPNPGTSSLRPRSDYRLRRRPTTVVQHRGDSLVAKGAYPCPAHLKIDVEGAECAVLDGMAHTLRRPDLRRVFCEAHPSLLRALGESLESLESRFADTGLTRTGRSERGTEVHLTYERNG